jgi:hypothetical protein
MARLSSGFAAILAVCLSACGSNPPPLDGTSCYPEAARSWISAAGDQPGATRDPGGPYAIYFDGSASMVGFIRGGTANERPLADLAGMLPNLDTIDRAKSEAIRFDRKIATLASADVARMSTEAGYLCPAGTPNCDAQESHIDQALSRIAKADTNSLSVVVSDLWLANSELHTTDGVALDKPLSDIFASGRSIAIYGLESPYAGRVNDLPSGDTNVTARRRYLFLVVVGPRERLQAFHGAMLNSSSHSIARDLKSGKAKYSLFTLEPVLAESSGTQKFELEPKSVLTKGSFLTVRTGVRIPQFRVEKSKALRSAEADNAPGATWQGVSNASILPGAVWEGASQGTTKLFKQVGEKCAPNGGDWRAEGELREGWRADGSAGFSLDPGELATLPSGRYLLVGTVRRTSLLSPNPSTNWMREWSFDSGTETQAIARPVMPTLNLAGTARLLEVALLKSAEKQPMNIGGFTVAVEIE